MQQPLEVGHVGKMVVNVLAMAMIFSTPDFNALQLLAESGRFALSELIVFHEVNRNPGIRQRLEKCGTLNFTSDSNAAVLELFKLASNQELVDAQTRQRNRSYRLSKSTSFDVA